MADPITWRTVAGNSLENAWRPMQGAVETFNGGLDRLSKVLEDRQAVNQGVADRGREANVQAYLDAVQGASTPEALQALHDSGHLDQLRANVDPRDLARVRGADEARLSTVHKNITDNRAFDDANTQFVNRDAINAALARAVQDRNPTVAIGMLPEGLPNRGELVKQIVGAAQGNAKFDADMGFTQAQTRHSDAQTTAVPQDIAIREEANRIADRTSRIQLLNSLTPTGGGGGGMGGGSGAGTPAGADASAGTLESAVNAQYKDNPQKARTMLRIAAQAINSADPRTADMLRQLPPDVMLRVLQAHDSDTGTGNWNPLDSNPFKFGLGNGVSDNVREDLIKQAGLDSVKRELKINQASQSLSINRAIEREQNRSALTQNLVSGVLGTPGVASAPGVSPGVAAGRAAILGPAVSAPAPAAGGTGDPDPVALARRYNGDSAKTVAAADVGPEVVDSAVAKYGNDWLTHLPKDTQDYVAEETKGKPSTIKGFGNPTAASAPVAPAPASSQKDPVATLAQTELALRDRGEIKNLSPEVQNYLDARTKQDRQTLIDSVKAAGSGTAKLGAAAADLFTLPVRAGMGVVNNGIRGINALGVNAPYIPDSNGIISSITPYSDMLARKTQGSDTADLKKLREKLVKDLRNAR